MAFPYGTLLFLVGVAYGFIIPGQENQRQLLLKAALAGLFAAAFLTLIGYFVKIDFLGLGTDLVSVVATFLLLAVLFTAGAWVGDFFEKRIRKNHPKNRPVRVEPPKTVLITRTVPGEPPESSSTAGAATGSTQT